MTVLEKPFTSSDRVVELGEVDVQPDVVAAATVVVVAPKGTTPRAMRPTPTVSGDVLNALIPTFAIRPICHLSTPNQDNSNHMQLCCLNARVVA
jgi:hypothetical protein